MPLIETGVDSFARDRSVTYLLSWMGIEHNFLTIVSLMVSYKKEVEFILDRMRLRPKSVRFRELRKVCDYYFGLPRIRKGSHRVYRMPWRGDPRVNIQNDKGMAKIYQVKQILKAIEKLENEYDSEK